MLDDGWTSELELQFAGPSPSEPVFDLKDESAAQWADEFDDHTGARLPGDLVHAGKMEKIRWVKEIGLHKKISRAEAKRRGITVVPTHNIADILTKTASREALIELRHVDAHTVVRRNSDLKVSSTVIQCLHVHSLRIKHSSSLATN